jgi:alcohol dehydrogenase class IV
VQPLPFIAVPTTAGTGSEVTRNAVLGSAEHGVKASLRSPMMLPRVALVDPELTYGLPPAVTAQTGLDALTQLIEPYVSVRANPLVDAICVEGWGASPVRCAARTTTAAIARRAATWRWQACSVAWRWPTPDWAWCMALRLRWEAQWKAPHGALCAALLPHGMAANVAALRARAPQNPALERYAADRAPAYRPQ